MDKENARIIQALLCFVLSTQQATELSVIFWNIVGGIFIVAAIICAIKE